MEIAKNTIARNLARGVTKERLTEAEAAAILAGIQFTTDASTAYKNADLAIEAVSEDESLKKMIFKQLDVSCRKIVFWPVIPLPLLFINWQPPLAPRTSHWHAFF